MILLTFSRRDDLLKMLHANPQLHQEEDEAPRRLVRQESVHCLEMEQNFLAPRVDGRIYFLTEEVWILSALYCSLSLTALSVSSTQEISACTDFPPNDNVFVSLTIYFRGKGDDNTTLFLRLSLKVLGLLPNKSSNQ